MTRKVLSVVLVLALILTLGVGCSSNSGSGEEASGDLGTYTIRIALENSEAFPATLGLYQMEKYVESHTDGNVQVDIYANGQLGGEEETLEQAAQGTIEMAVASFAPLATYVPDFELMDIPFMYATYEEAWMVLDSYVGTDLMASLESANLKGLAYMENGFRQTTNSVKPITCLADFAGLKIRTMQNNDHMANFSALGANPTPVPFSELYMAMSQKVADGQENPIANVVDKLLYEVQGYLSLTNHLYDAMPLVCNLDFWNSLPAEYQGVVQAGAIYGQEYSRFCNAAREAEMSAFLEEQGMKINSVTVEAQAEMAAVGQPAVIELVASDIGQDKVDQFMADVEAVLGDIHAWK